MVAGCVTVPPVAPRILQLSVCMEEMYAPLVEELLRHFGLRLGTMQVHYEDAHLQPPHLRAKITNTTIVRAPNPQTSATHTRIPPLLQGTKSYRTKEAHLCSTLDMQECGVARHLSQILSPCSLSIWHIFLHPMVELNGPQDLTLQCLWDLKVNGCMDLGEYVYGMRVGCLDLGNSSIRNGTFSESW